MATNIYYSLLTIHLLAIIVWIGGMFFAHMILRPTAQNLLEPSQRLPFLTQIFSRFFIWVWIAIVLLWVSGAWITFGSHGGMAKAPVYLHIMWTLGGLMTVLFTYIFFVPFSKLKQAVAEANFPLGGQHMNRIRYIVLTNLILGITTSIIAVMGKLM